MLEDKEQKAFFNLLLNKNATNEYTKDLKTYIEVAKKNTQWRHTFMDWDRDYLYDLEESEQRGIQQKALQTARIALENNIPLEMIIKLTGLAEDEILALSSEVVPAFES